MRDIAAISNFLKENPKAKEMLLYLIDNSDDNGVLKCSYFDIADALGLSFPIISRTITAIKGFGLATVSSSDTSHIYLVDKKLRSVLENI